MFERLKAYLAAPETKASRTAKFLAFQYEGRARWTAKDYTSLAREGYIANAVVHRAVRLIAENAAGCRFVVFDGADEREAHPLAQLLTRPNPRQDGSVFFETLYAHLLLAGNAYVEAVALDDAVRELHALRPDRMKLIAGRDGWAEAYEYTVNGRTVRFDQAASHVPPILHLTFFHPLDDHYGLAPIDAAATALENMNYSAGRMMQVWPSRFPTMASAAPYAGNPRALANKVYNGRMGNAVGSDDGWNFRGRGGSQTTGREGYERVRKATGIDVVGHPEYLIDPRYFLTCAVSDFINCGCLPFAKADDVVGVTRRLNGGTVGLAERKAWLAQWKAALRDVSPATAPSVGPSPAIASPSLAPELPTAKPTNLSAFITALVAAFRRT